MVIWTEEYHREYMKNKMRSKRAEDPKYGRSKCTKITIAYCRTCKTEQHWIDADNKEGIYYCKACGNKLYSLVEQRTNKKV